MKKKMTIASATVLTLAVVAMAVPSVYAQTTETVKQIGRGFMERGAGFHRGGFDNATFLEEQASILGITVDDLKTRLEAGKTVKDIASNLGISEEVLQAKMKAVMTAKLAQDVADGKITQKQADERIANMGNGPWNGNAIRGERRGPKDGRGMIAMKDDATFLEEHAVMLGITADDLKARLESGKTIKDIAAELGISDEDLQAKMEEVRTAHQAEMKATMTAKLTQDVADGKITQEQADKMLERLQNPNANKHGFGFGGGFEGMGRHGGPRPSGAPSTVSAQ